jgi:hypothetical protein
MTLVNTPLIRFSLVIAFGWAASAILLPAQAPISGPDTLAAQSPHPLPDLNRDLPPPSPPCKLIQTIGKTNVTLVYHRPDVRGRKIFGGLIPYGEVWRTGANNETTIEFSNDVKLNGVPIPAGKYGLFTIPDRDEWTFIVDKNSEMWGAFTYNPTEALVRFKVKPVPLSMPVETFGIEIRDVHDDSAITNILWETTRVPITIDTALVDKVLAEINTAMASPDPKPPGFYGQAASFYNDHVEDRHLDLKKALDWVNKAIDAGTVYGTMDRYGPINYSILLKAQIQAKLGEIDGARASAQTVLDMAAHDQSIPAIEHARIARYFLDSLEAQKDEAARRQTSPTRSSPTL